MTEPSPEEWDNIAHWCVIYQVQAQPELVARDDEFEGTIGGLSRIYQTHRHSPFNKLRKDAKRNYTYLLSQLERTIGRVAVLGVTFNDIIDWQEKYAEGGYKQRAVKMIGILRRVISFGALVLPEEAGCLKLVTMFQLMKNKKLLLDDNARRESYVTAAYAQAIITKAHEAGYPSIALAQALQYECGLRQKDVIGEWLDRDTWAMGLRWEEINAHWVVRHRLSKSLHGLAAIEDPKAGKTSIFDLKLCPLVMVELKDAMTVRPLRGPLIICEATGRPWDPRYFRRVWRKIADAAGVPAAVQNRDSRAGAATEARGGGAPMDDIRGTLAHNDVATTEIYTRDQLDRFRRVQELRLQYRRRARDMEKRQMEKQNQG